MASVRLDNNTPAACQEPSDTQECRVADDALDDARDGATSDTVIVFSMLSRTCLLLLQRVYAVSSAWSRRRKERVPERTTGHMSRAGRTRGRSTTFGAPTTPTSRPAFCNGPNGCVEWTTFDGLKSFDRTRKVDELAHAVGDCSRRNARGCPRTPWASSRGRPSGPIAPPRHSRPSLQPRT